MHRKILAIALPFPGASPALLWDASDAATLLARTIRSADRGIANSELVSLPWLDGARGTMDFLVTHSLGSFLEVEATGSSGEDVVAPIGFAGADGTLAVIELSRVAQVRTAGQPGTTAGVGELIQDALDEGAFSILLCHFEPLASDAGFGAASALGVKFFDAHDKEVLFSSPEPRLAGIMRVDASGRSFALLSSRIFLARSASATSSRPAPELLAELERLAEIIHRDTGIPPSMTNLSASAIEFGLTAFLGTEPREGHALVLEASRIEEAIERGEFSEVIVLVPSTSELESPPLRKFLDLVQTRIDRRALVLGEPLPKGDGVSLDRSFSGPIYSLADVAMFQAPIGPNAGMEERRRDFGMRLEKLMPTVLSTVDDRSSTLRQDG